MVIQHFVPKHVDECPLCIIYYENVMVWVVGSFALLGFLLVLSLIPVQIGIRRRQYNQEFLDDQAVLPQNIEIESDNEA